MLDHVFRSIGAAVVLACCLLGATLNDETGCAGIITRELRAAIHDPLTQWAIFTFLGTYLLFFLLRRRRAVFLLGITLAVGTSHYASNYSVASEASEALTWLAGMLAGQLVVALLSKQERDGETDFFLLFSVIPLLALLLVASVWVSQIGHPFEYRGQPRWSGPWDNPNIYGLLMGTGVALALAFAAFTVQGLVFKGKGVGSWKLGVGKYLCASLCIIAAGLTGRGLFHSYSRGAWVATLAGLAYLALRLRRPIQTGSSQFTSFCRRNWVLMALTAVSLFILVFWQMRESEWRPARRVLSMANVNDFSWRNRLTAWEGALQIMADYPWFGLGWNRTEPLYEHYYLPPRITESIAIQMNDYLTLGATLGIPALICFVIYIWLSLTRNSELKTQDSSNTWPRVVCRAGAIVLAVGFWFDGGLFNLPTASTFWILLELGRADLAPRGAIEETQAGSTASAPSPA